VASLSGAGPRILRFSSWGIGAHLNDATTADCYPLAATPGLSRLFIDFSSGEFSSREPGAHTLRAFLPSPDNSFARPPLPAHWPQLAKLLAAQNPSATDSIQALTQGAGVVVTGQQVGLFGGPLFTPFKAATAIARARRAAALGHPHVAIFWLASEDHDFDEVNHVAVPAGRELKEYVYASAPETARPVGSLVFDDSIVPLAEQAGRFPGSEPPESTAAQLLAAYAPGRTFAQAFAHFYATAFAAQGLLTIDASGRDFHRLGAPVLRAGIERADEFHTALLDRNRALEAAGYQVQVAVAPQSSLLFLIDEKTGARQALKRTAPSAAEPHGLWHAGQEAYSTADLVGILSAEPERISPSALLRPVFQDFLLAPSSIVAGPAEIAYFAQSGVLYERILGRQTPPAARLSATLIEPHVGELLRKHALTLDNVFAEDDASLARSLAARSMPPETKQKLNASAEALDAELAALVAWLQSQDKGLGQSAETAANKIQYQMNRLRTLAANFQLQREATLTRHAETLAAALFPGGVLQERVHGAAYYFARYDLGLAETLCAQAAQSCPGHMALWL
jgi:bacillithiol biosynthesis cysteine-adding enzyme BshC